MADVVPRCPVRSEGLRICVQHVTARAAGAGNFKTLQQCIAEYGADACRMGLADAGDSMDDANFDEKASAPG